MAFGIDRDIETKRWCPRCPEYSAVTLLHVCACRYTRMLWSVTVTMHIRKGSRLVTLVINRVSGGCAY